MFKLIAIAIITIALNGVYLAAANSADRYGAIAYSPSTGSVGWSHDYDSRRGAERRAQNGCRDYASDCRVAIWARNACAALAVGRNGGWASYLAYEQGTGEVWGPACLPKKRQRLQS